MTAWMWECLWKGTVILAAALAASRVLRRGPAAWRHFLWTAAFAALAILPAAVRVAPKWRPAPAVRVQGTPVPAGVARVTGGRAKRSPESPRSMPVLPLVWMAGAAGAAAWFATGAGRAWRMIRRGRRAEYAESLRERLTRSLAIGRTVRVVESGAATLPMTWGIARPVVVLPEGAGQWPEERLHAAMLHELVHVRRLDLLAQVIAQAGCCLFWFHPLAWVALSELRKEREGACDDAVLARGMAATEYAGHLMDLVRAVAARRANWADAPAMAEASGLEVRIRALLDRKRNRRPLSRGAVAGIVAAGLALMAPLCVLTAQAAGAIAGVVQDPSGARVPGCRVTAKNLDGSNQETTVADAAGEYRFAAIPPGRYTVEFAGRGFALGRAETTLTAGAESRVNMNLALGSVTENVVIKAPRAAGTAMAAPRAAAPERVRVGGQVTPARVIRQSRPDYPAELQRQGVQGTVVMAAVISKTGEVLHPQVRNTVDARLAQAALDAVKQWAYQPALLNGEPVETLTTITLEFQLEQ